MTITKACMDELARVRKERDEWKNIALALSERLKLLQDSFPSKIDGGVSDE